MSTINELNWELGNYINNRPCLVEKLLIAKKLKTRSKSKKVINGVDVKEIHNINKIHVII